MRKHNEYSNIKKLNQYTCKSPDIKKILKNIHLNNTNNNSLDVKVIKNSEIQNLIHDQISKKKFRIRKEKAEINNIKNEKPYMSVKSVERFQVFKE